MSDPADITLRDTLDKANPNTLPTALQKVKLGRRLSSVKVTISGLTASATVDITSAAALAAATVVGLNLADNERLPAIELVKTLRVTAVGTAALGPRIVVDSGGTAIAPSTYAGHAKLSDDGTTLTFEGTVTGLIIEYMPRSATDLDTVWPHT